MKFVKKALVVLMCACMLIPAFAFAVGAEATKQDPLSYLEYYDTDSVLVQEWFSAAPGALMIEPGMEVQYDNGAIVLKHGNVKAAFCEVANPDQKQGIGVNFSFKTSSAVANIGGYVSVEFSGTSASSSNDAEFGALLNMGAEPAMKYGEFGNDGAVSVRVQEVEGFVPATNTWYTVNAFYDAAAGTVTLRVSDSVKVCADIVYNTRSVFTEVSTVAVRFPKTGLYGYTNAGVTNTIDCLEVYTGTVLRENFKKQSMLEAAVLDMAAEFEKPEASFAYKDAVINTIEGLETNGFTSDVAQVNTAISNIKNAINPLYISTMKTFSEKLDTTLAYSVRLALVDEYAVIYDRTKASEALSTDAALKSAVDAYAAEQAALVVIYNNAEAFKDKSNTYDPDFNYAELDQWIKDMEAFHVDLSYPYISVPLKNYLTAVSERESRQKIADKFIESTGIMDNDSLDFGTRYNAFLEANRNRFDDESYGEVNEVKNANLIFNARKEALISGAAECSAFITKVGQADSALYHDIRVAYTEEAAALMAADKLAPYTGYSGLAEAFNAYYALVERIATDAENAEKYLAAVAVLSKATTFAEKKAAALECERLKVLGDVRGYKGDAMSNANTAYSQAIVEVFAIETNSKNFISYVNDLKNLSDLAARRELIFNANSLLTKADDEYAGVPAAKTAFASELSRFTAEVNAANTKSATMVRNSLDAVCAVIDSSLSAKVIAVVKKFYE